MAITTEMIKDLREKTGAGVLDCRKALQEALGDMEKAIAILREQGLAKAAKKAERAARDGIVEAYVHPGARLAAIVEVNCETDFVARTPEFKALAHDLAMQIAAARPLYVSKDEVPPELVEAERKTYLAQLAEENKPPQVIENIIAGKLNKLYEQIVLLEQPFIKDETIKVGNLVAQHIARLGENIVVHRFARFAIGEE